MPEVVDAPNQTTVEPPGRRRVAFWRGLGRVIAMTYRHVQAVARFCYRLLVGPF